MSNMPQSDKHEATVWDQADIPERSDDELSEQQLNGVAGGALFVRDKSEAASGASDAYVWHNDNISDPNDLMSR